MKYPLIFFPKTPIFVQNKKHDKITHTIKIDKSSIGTVEDVFL